MQNQNFRYFKKHLLSEHFLIEGFIVKELKINPEEIKSHILNHYNEKYQSGKGDIFSKFNQYYDIGYHQHIHWIQDHLKDHYKATYDWGLVVNDTKAVIQKQNEMVNTHNHLTVFDLNGSPDVSMLYTLQSGEENSFVIFDYDDGRKKERQFKIELVPNKFVLFSSHIPHRITENKNKDLMINISYKFQLY